MNFYQDFNTWTSPIADLVVRKFMVVFYTTFTVFLGTVIFAKKIFFIERKFSSFLCLDAAFLPRKTGETEKLGVEITSRITAVGCFVLE